MNTRRHFLKSTAAASLVGPAVIPAAALGSEKKPAASERITVGLVGCGAQGLSNLRNFLALPDAQVIAVCDVQDLHWRDKRARGGKPYGRDAAKLEVDTKYGDSGCAVYADYRELCARDDIDAVVVATPDHWHALCTLEALRSGKDVYCEKPVTHTFAEGQMVYREAAKQKAIFQTGSQQRSSKEFRNAVEIIQNGLIGKITRVEVGLPAGKETPTEGIEVTEPPKGLDYDFWCGPGQKLPYMFARHHRAWRQVLTWGGGNLMDWIGHHNDIAHWGLDYDRNGPVSVEARGWTWTDGSVFDAPIDYEIVCEYPGGIEWSISSQNQMGVKWIGETGWIRVDRGTMERHDPWATNTATGPKPAINDQTWWGDDFIPGPKRVFVSPGHHRNFIDGVKTRTECIAPAETAHRSITPGHLAYVSQAVGRKLKWDALKEKIIGDESAQEKLMAVNYRAPWKFS